MSNYAIEIEGLWKQYRLGESQPYLMLRDLLSHPFGGKEKSKDEFWALKDINLKVKEGEVLGVIGKNGSGKSTLLKILTRITPPTKGQVKLHGRVASLLEVGTGFSPELTGRENIFLNGSILGMTRQEIRRKFDEIVDFSGVEKFIDTPVKRYSSGMYVRLAFAVAAHLESEILLVDEVLAVGDAEFQKKCMGKMRQVVEKEKRTIFFVSHSMDAIANLCQNVLVLNAGIVSSVEPASPAINRYLRQVSQSTKISLDKREDREGKGNIRLIAAKVIPADLNSVSIGINEDFFVDVTIKNLYKKEVRFHIHLNIRTANDFGLISLDTEQKGQSLSIPAQSTKTYRCHIKKPLLNSGTFFVNLGIWHLGQIEDAIRPAIEFTIDQTKFDNRVKNNEFPALAYSEWKLTH